jgi:uncharacterized protein
MKDRALIRYFVGGPSFHPTRDQAVVINKWLGDRYRYEIRDGAEAFDGLEEVDLLVIMGLHWTGLPGCKLTYEPLNDARKNGFRNYVRAGKPILNFHGGIASYDDWPEFGLLLGFRWDWKLTTHAHFGDLRVTIGPEPHPITEGISDHELADELYVNIQATPGMAIGVHARTDQNGAKFPMILTGEGGRIEGAGRTVYLANGHDLRAFECPALPGIWKNTVRWLLGEK